ncbi:histamine H2 receptor-like [Xiphophorus maculatus]|uniref:Histamine H2 receptor n=1 Tax=Xiphophorus maculatus TaxID=8083 RepID=A0A3B5R1U7_XIPMA|nr:histamine H2 receptor-like [Xiphophorus maculatus]XP_023197621.1 histamine H2 receptor-like [Xiphophorus maculatus]
MIHFNLAKSDSNPVEMTVTTVLRWLFLVSVILLTIGGNILVCLAVGLSRRLWRTANCFVVSLAIADLLLGVLVLPLSATLELRNSKWPFGGTLCNIYISVDVMLCTCSILTLLAISVNRYLAISSPLSHSQRVTPRRVSLAIIFIWLLSLAVAFFPIHLGWNTADYRVQNLDWEFGDEGTDKGHYCQFEFNNNYVLIYAFGSFYLPLMVMCGMYLCIFRVAREQVRRIRATTPSFARSATAAIAREHKATVTLAAVLGAFIICWFPYFSYFTCMGVKEKRNPPNTLHSVVLWLGYLNSTLNPILYPAFNRDFRRAYGELLRCRGSSRRTLQLTPVTLYKRLNFFKLFRVSQNSKKSTAAVMVERQKSLSLPCEGRHGADDSW